MQPSPLYLRLEPLEPRLLLAHDTAEVRTVEDVFAAVRRGDLAFDLDENGQINHEDARFLVEDVLQTRLGDANLDGSVNFEDFLRMSNQFGRTDVDYALGDFDGNQIVDFADFLLLSSNFGFESLGHTLSLKDGATRIPNRTIFDMLAHQEDVPGAAGIPEVKFVVEVATQEVTFLNHHRHDLHFTFAKDVLGYTGSIYDFNRDTYFTDNRRFVAGSILAHDNFESHEQQGVFVIEFWPTDLVKAHHAILTTQIIQQAVPFAADGLAYHPAGETQRALFERERQIYEAQGVPTIATEELFGNQTFSALHEGVAYGQLRAVDGTDGVPLTLRDLVIFEHIPNDLTHVAGVITVQPQTPLSHVNLRAKQNDTPNAFIKNALNDPQFVDLLGKLVRFEVIGDGYAIREATPEEVDEHFASVRPKEVQHSARDLSRRSIVPLASLRRGDQSAYGAKAANLGELASILPDAQVPDGLALPFALYDDFMQANGLYEKAHQMVAQPSFKTNSAVREKMLKDFREEVRDAAVSPEVSSALEEAYAALKQQFGETASFRARSSTNNEDLEGFTGAGLYESYTHRPHEGKLENTIKQVWSSLWTFRAFEEREFWRIDHFTAAMGVAIHPNFDFEEVNGVAVTKNIYDPFFRGFYVNAQVGEDLVTNPEGGAIPEEFLLSAIGPQPQIWELQYIRRSNLTEDGSNVLSPHHVAELRDAMQTIQEHFRTVYNGDSEFAMDIEFKVDANGQLVVKQARPWVD